MELEYFDHAEFRLAERGITKDDIEVALADRSIVLLPRGDHHHIIGYVNARGLHIVFKYEKDGSIWVVTAYWVT